jgi:hypothetical protein
MWVDTEKQKPNEKKRYPIVIWQKDESKYKIGFSYFYPKKNKFHFDIHHINWKVIKWFNLPDWKDT